MKRVLIPSLFIIYSPNPRKTSQRSFMCFLTFPQDKIKSRWRLLLNRNICEHKRKIPSQFSHRITVEVRKEIYFLCFLQPSRLQTFSAYVPPFVQQGIRVHVVHLLKNFKTQVCWLIYEIRHHRHCPCGKPAYYPQSRERRICIISKWRI